MCFLFQGDMVKAEQRKGMPFYLIEYAELKRLRMSRVRDCEDTGALMCHWWEF